MTITIQALDRNRFEVTVEAETATKHIVTVRDEYLRMIAGDSADPKDVIRKSFEFLMERESNSSILSSFDLSVIQRYFPSYEENIRSAFHAG